MPRVPVYDETAIRSSALPGYRQNVGGVGEGLIRTGRTLAGVAGYLGQWSDQIRQRSESSALAQFEADVGDIDRDIRFREGDGVFRLQGQAAVARGIDGPLEERRRRVEDASGRFSGNRRLAEAARISGMQSGGRFRLDLENWQLRELSRAEQEAHAARTESGVSDAIAVADNPTLIESSVQDSLEKLYGSLERQGATQERIDLELSEFASRAWGGAVQRLIDEHHVGPAREMYAQKAKAWIIPGSREDKQIQATLEPEEDDQRARALASEIMLPYGESIEGPEITESQNKVNALQVPAQVKALVEKYRADWIGEVDEAKRRTQRDAHNRATATILAGGVPAQSDMKLVTDSEMLKSLNALQHQEDRAKTSDLGAFFPIWNSMTPQQQDEAQFEFFVPYLAEKDRNWFAKLQQGERTRNQKGIGSVYTPQKHIEIMLRPFKKTLDEESIGNLEGAALDAVNLEQLRKGGPLNDQEIRDALSPVFKTAYEATWLGSRRDAGPVGAIPADELEGKFVGQEDARSDVFRYLDNWLKSLKGFKGSGPRNEVATRDVEEAYFKWIRGEEPEFDAHLQEQLATDEEARRTAAEAAAGFIGPMDTSPLEGIPQELVDELMDDPSGLKLTPTDVRHRWMRLQAMNRIRERGIAGTIPIPERARMRGLTREQRSSWEEYYALLELGYDSDEAALHSGVIPPDSSASPSATQIEAP